MIDLKDKKRPEYVEQVIKTIRTKNIKFVRLQFIDINGIIKSFSVSTKNIEETMENGQYFDGSSITGYGSIEESDMIAIPDPTTFAIIPWREEEISTCRLICDIYDGSSRFEADPRYILQKAVNRAKEEGYIYKCAPELEFFILTEEETEFRTPQPLDMKGYFDLHPGDITENLRREMCDIAEKFGITVEVAHHEVALGQNEIDFKYDEAVTTADRTITMKSIIKGTAARNGYLATFMPKPFFGVNGSGMHVHQSLWTLDDQNAFYSEDPEKSHLSEIAFYFIGGQLKYGRQMSAILASWPNSYKRLVPGYEAPVYMAWGHKNRSPLIRVPDFGKRKKAARMEIRCPDPAGNPYLQFAVLLGTGLLGIQEKINPPEPTDMNVYKLSYEERAKMNIVSLPESLAEALHEMENSQTMKKILGEKLFKNFLDVKWAEWDAYRTQISDWEFERYIDKL